MNADQFFKRAYLIIAVQNALLLCLNAVIVMLIPAEDTEFPVRGGCVIVALVLSATISAYILTNLIKPKKEAKNDPI